MSGGRVGIAGLGRMGAPIARALVAGGFAVMGFDPVAARLSAAAGSGVTAAPSAEALADWSELVVTVLPGAPEFEELMSRETGFLAAMRPGSVWLDLTSNDPRVARAAADLSRERGVVGVAAPMGGGVSAAEQRTLRFFVGASESELARVRPVLEALGGRQGIEHVGPHLEDGYTAKLLANLLWFGQAAAVTEALLLGQALGIEPRRLIEVLKPSAGGGVFLAHHASHLLAGDYMEEFGLDRCVEELRIVSELAAGENTPFMVSQAVTKLHESTLDAFGAVPGELLVAKYLEQLSGRTLRGPDSTPER